MNNYELINIEKLSETLHMFDLTSKQNDGVIIIDYKPFEFEIKFQNEKIYLKSKIIGWNFVTDFIKMDFEKSLRYLLVKLSIYIIVAFFLISINQPSFTPLVLFALITFILNTVLFQLTYYLHYRIKHEHFKKNIMDWVMRSVK